MNFFSKKINPQSSEKLLVEIAIRNLDIANFRATYVHSMQFTEHTEITVFPLDSGSLILHACVDIKYIGYISLDDFSCNFSEAIDTTSILN